MAYVKVPVGRSKKRDESSKSMVDGLSSEQDCNSTNQLSTKFQCTFQQQSRQTCVTSSIANALEYLGWSEEAVIMENFGIAYIEEHGTSFKLIAKAKLKLDLLLGTKNLQGRRLEHEFDILNAEESDAIKLIVLQASDGDESHCVAVVRNLIFDSTMPHALLLNKKNLDYICGTNSLPYMNPTYTYVRVGYHYCPRTIFPAESYRTKKRKRRKRLQDLANKKLKED